MSREQFVLGKFYPRRINCCIVALEEKVLEKISAWKIDGWDDLIQGKFFFGRKILVNKLPGGKSSGKRWGQTDQRTLKVGVSIYYRDVGSRGARGIAPLQILAPPLLLHSPHQILVPTLQLAPPRFSNLQASLHLSVGT